MAVAAIMVGAAGCVEARDATTAPAAHEAAAIDWLWWLALGLGVAVYLVVMALLAVPLIRSRRRARQDTDADRHPEGPTSRAEGDAPAPLAPPAAIVDEPIATADPALRGEAASDERVRGRLVWIGGVVGPAVILLVLLLASSMVGRSVAHVERDGELVIDVVGHMFWWEVHYPDLDITTANEIHVPVDQPVRLRLTTRDVIHSFWIPRLHGKIDMIPGTENWLTFEATETGRFRGQCAEFCGIAHAQMVAFVEVRDADDFDAWVAQQRADATPPADAVAAMGERVFLDVGCAACHAVGGTTFAGDVGPDLTHLASRESLAGGIVPNTRDNLERLIVDPWGLKPGNPMPPTELADDELEALLDYLEGLE